MATIGIDVTALSTSASGGIGASQYEVMRALAALGSEHRFIMYAAARPVVPFTDRPLDLRWPLRLGRGLTARSNIVWMQTGVNRLLRQDQVDLFWSPRHLLPFRARGVATVANIQDFWHVRYPEQQPWRNRTANRLLIGRIVRVADRIVTASQSVADEAVEFCAAAPERISVVPLGVDSAMFRRLPGEQTAPVLDRYRIPGRFVLAMDIHNPRKNFAAVLEGFAKLPADRRAGVTVVGLGRPRPTAGDVDPAGLAARLGIAGQVVLPGDAPLEDLLALYSTAQAFVYPSWYEGFGMPVLEAMACGCPVITSDRSSLPEAAGGAALLVDPGDPAGIAVALERLLGDESERDRLVEAGRAHAAAMSWRATAEGMLRVFEDVLGAKGKG